MRSTLILIVVASVFLVLGHSAQSDPPPAQLGVAGGFGNALGVPVSSGSLIVVAPESRDSIVAWSHDSGVWNRIPIKPKPQDAIVPIVGNDVAAIRVGKMVYGYGAESGKWHWIKTEAGNAPSVGNRSVTVSDGDWYYAFSAKAGKWSGLNLKTGETR